MKATTWVFDVDGCLVDSLTGTSLRPGAAALLSQLRSDGCEVLLWSAGGADYARLRATQQGIDALVSGYHGKASRDDAGRYVTDVAFARLDDVVFVDDRPEDLPVGADVVAVSPYLSDDRHDRGLAGAAARAGVRGGAAGAPLPGRAEPDGYP